MTHPTSPRDHTPRNIAPAAATFLVWVVTLGGSPLVANALSESRGELSDGVSVLATLDVPPPRAGSIPDLGAVLVRPSPPIEAVFDRAPEPAPEVPPTPVLEQAGAVESPAQATIRVLSARYAWDERSARVEELQRSLGVEADGWYADVTLRAHRSELETRGFPTAILPDAPARPARSGPSPSQWAALRRCESSGNYSALNPSGRYRGAYQFDRPTWNSVASRHAPHLVGADPAAASPADQDAMALALYRSRGAQPWPHCGRHLR
jgi:hypothetical protein